MARKAPARKKPQQTDKLPWQKEPPPKPKSGAPPVKLLPGGKWKKTRVVRAARATARRK